jgi:ABC-2 type transport system permease protein
MTTYAPTGQALRFHPLRDSATMLRRNLKRMLRYPSMTVTLVGMPVVFLLLFVYVLGGTLGAGIGGAAGGGAPLLK